MQKITKKQFMKRKTLYILHQILCERVEPDVAEKLTVNDVYRQFPKASYFKSQDNGEIRVGLSYKGVRKLVKKNPYVTVEEVKKVFNLG